MLATQSDATSPPRVAAVFRVTVAPELGAALRVVNLFAQQGLLPDKIGIAARAGDLVISVRQSMIDPRRAELIVDRMRAQVDVIKVAFSFRPGGHHRNRA
jgi:membrane-associated protease RseP (regulator of RpoE activity)